MSNLFPNKIKSFHDTWHASTTEKVICSQITKSVSLLDFPMTHEMVWSHWYVSMTCSISFIRAIIKQWMSFSTHLCPHFFYTSDERVLSYSLYCHWQIFHPNIGAASDGWHVLEFYVLGFKTWYRGCTQQAFHTRKGHFTDSWPGTQQNLEEMCIFSLQDSSFEMDPK